MIEGLKEILLGYVVTVFLTAGFFIWMLKGFFAPFIRVKAQRGKLVLIKVRGVTRNYFKTGKVNGNVLKFKNAAKDVCTVTNITPDDFEDIIGVKMVYVDESSGAIINGQLPRTSSIKSGHDPIQTEQIIIRALTKPSAEDLLKKIVIICLVIMFIILIFNSFLLYQINPQLAQISQTIGSLNTTII